MKELKELSPAMKLLSGGGVAHIIQKSEMEYARLSSILFSLCPR